MENRDRPTGLQRQLELVHLQLTKNCNLRCWFCGQWGTKGSFKQEDTPAMTTKDWEHVVDLLEHRAEKDGCKPDIILWGGEPLVSPDFTWIAERLYRSGFKLGLVTNGTLLHQHIDLCRSAFSRIYLSVDGLPQTHNEIRGKGVYETVAENLKALHGGRVNLTLMSVVTPQLLDRLVETLQGYELLQPNEVLLQEMITLNPQEVAAYRQWLEEAFGMSASGIDSWLGEGGLQLCPQWLHEQLKDQSFSFAVQHLPHTVATQEQFCLSPFRHLHIAWDGKVSFCTDFTDFSLGNVREQDIYSLFDSPLAHQFSEEIQQGHCPTCNHCSWINSRSFRL